MFSKQNQSQLLKLGKTFKETNLEVTFPTNSILQIRNRSVEPCIQKKTPKTYQIPKTVIKDHKEC